MDTKKKDNITAAVKKTVSDIGLSVAGMVADKYLGTSSIVGDIILSGALSNLPIIGNFFLSYQKTRAEDNIMSFMDNIDRRVKELELQGTWDAKNERLKELFIKRFAGIVCDYVIEEKEKVKIPYLAGGVISMIAMDELMDEQRVIEYYDVLSRLRSIDLQVLIDYIDGTFMQYETPGAKIPYITMRGITYDELTYIQKKLVDHNVMETDRIKRNMSSSSKSPRAYPQLES